MAVFVIALVILGAIAFGVSIGYREYYKRYSEFVFNHSAALKNIQALNSKYTFNPIPSSNMCYSYDNEIFYNSISPQDYLTYKLACSQQNIQASIQKVKENQVNFIQYQKEIERVLVWGIYDAPIPFKNIARLAQIEIETVHNLIQKPAISFEITVCLRLTNIRGRYRTSKQELFGIAQIENIIGCVNKKENGRYQDRQVWDAICRVERGKVTNKVRFAVYERDGYRCRKCGAQTRDLEIDHIYPISKGGKSNFDNLQTLCHSCNTLKSDSVGNTWQQTTISCPFCNAPLVLRTGKYGRFYGCSNYPRCKYTKKQM